jgi:S1-C subfamily serine protease
MVQDSPADRAGIRPGDIITHINGSAVISSKDIYNFLDGDEKLRMTMIRAGKIIKINVNLDS